MPKSTAVVFDLDGTLIDSAPAIAKATNQMLSDLGADPLPPSQIRTFVGKGAPHLVHLAIAEAGLPNDLHAKAVEIMLGYYESANAENTIYPNVIDALSALQNAGYALGICTNKPGGPTKAVLDHLDLSRFFDVVMSGDSLPTRKPDPAPLNAAFDALDRQNRLYVGDSEIDAATAEAANVPFLLYSEGYRKSPLAELRHDIAFEDFAALQEIVTRLT